MARANKRRKGTQIFDRRKVESERENEMVEKYGMGNLIKVFSKSDTYGKTYSAETYSIIDEEALGLINYAYDRVLKIMKNNKKCLENVVDILSDKLVINGVEFSDLLIKNKCIFDDRDGVKTTDLSDCECGL